MWYWFFKFTIFRPLVVWGWRSRIVGAENVPERGGAIIAANHIANIDSLVIPALLPRRLTYPAKAELFSGKGFKGRIVAWFLRSIGQVPMDRAGGRASAASLGEITDVLEGGNLIGIYPEGTRSPDGRLYKGKTGVARMALMTQVPVIPVGVQRTPSTRSFLGIGWPDRPVVTVGRPLTFEEFYDHKTDAKVLRWVTDEVMAAIAPLSGQEYADVYGFRVKAGDLKDVGSDAFVRPRPGDGAPKPSFGGSE